MIADQIRGLRSVMRRLEKSEGRRIARRNAHKELDKLLSRIRRKAREQYPPLSKDGKSTLPVKMPKGHRHCPLCRTVRTPTRAVLAEHVLAKHGGRCCCGFIPKAMEDLWATSWTTLNDKIKRRAVAAMSEHLKHMGVDHLKVASTMVAIGSIGDPQKFHWVEGQYKVQLPKVLSATLKRVIP